jgi:hypothetical protein
MAASTLPPVILRRLSANFFFGNELFRSVRDAITQYVEPNIYDSVVHSSDAALSKKLKSKVVAEKKQKREGTRYPPICTIICQPYGVLTCFCSLEATQQRWQERKQIT